MTEWPANYLLMNSHRWYRVESLTDPTWGYCVDCGLRLTYPAVAALNNPAYSGWDNNVPVGIPKCRKAITPPAESKMDQNE